MVIQNLNAGLLIPNRNLHSSANQDNQTQLQLSNPTEVKELATVPTKAVNSVSSTQKQLSLLDKATFLLKGTTNPDKKFSSIPLRAYDSISELEQLQQLSSLIGIDVHV